MIFKNEKVDKQLRLVMTQEERTKLDEISVFYGVSRNKIMRQMISFAHETMKQKRDYQ